MTDREVSNSATPRWTTGTRWFISAPNGLDLRPLLAMLHDRGAAGYVLSDVARLGDSILQGLQAAIATADRVLVVLARDESSVNCAFEAGMAAALGKPLIIVADPDVPVPPDIAGFLTIKARVDDIRAITFALDQAEGRVVTVTPLILPMGDALGARADALLDRALKILALDGVAAVEEAFIDVLKEAIESSGAIVVDGANRDQQFDLGVWSDDLGAISANPLLIELKRILRPEGVRRALSALHTTSSAQVVLIVYLDSERSSSSALEMAKYPVLAISLVDLLVQMRKSSFAEVVRHLRNRSVHGLPTE
jgi:predicted nucleotide-binding protein